MVAFLAMVTAIVLIFLLCALVPAALVLVAVMLSSRISNR